MVSPRPDRTEASMKSILQFALASAVIFCCLGALPASALTAGQTLDNAYLERLPDRPGHETRPLSQGSLVISKIDTRMFFIQVVIRTDGAKSGLNANFETIEDFAAVPPKRWLELLVSYGQIDPSTLCVYPDQKKIFLHRVVDNHSITPTVLRGQPDKFTNDIISTDAAWDLSR
jgi:hypothetical protein